MKSCMLGLAMIAMLATNSFAGYLKGSASFGNATQTGLDSSTNSDAAFIISFNNQSGGTFDFSGGAFAWGTASIGPLSVSGSNAPTITGAFGTFTGATWFQDTYNRISDSLNDRTLRATGLFSRAGFTDTPSILTIQVQESGGSFTVQGTLLMDPPPPAAVPEPASMAIFGLGVAGFAVRRFRRK